MKNIFLVKTAIYDDQMNISYYESVGAFTTEEKAIDYIVGHYWDRAEECGWYSCKEEMINELERFGTVLDEIILECINIID